MSIEKPREKTAEELLQRIWVELDVYEGRLTDETMEDFRKYMYSKPRCEVCSIMPLGMPFDCSNCGRHY